MASSAWTELVRKALGPEWFVHRESDRPDEVDAVFVGPRGRRVLAEMKKVPQRGIEDLQARAALAVLQLRRYAQPSDQALIVLQLARVTPRSAEALAAFLHENAPDVGWLVFDEGGSARCRVEALGIDFRSARIAPPTKGRQPAALFSDLNRWMFKVLLLHGAPASWWGGPRETAATPTALASIAAVSVAKAHQMVHLLEQKGLLSRRGGALGIREPERFLRMWLDHERIETVERVPAQWAIGRSGDVKPFGNYAGRWALGGYAAIDVAGLRHVSTHGPPLVHVDDVAAVCRELDLVVVPDSRDAHVMLSRPRHPESMFRGRVAAGAWWYVDIWQAALDVAGDRGGEQAEYLLGRIAGAAP